MTAAPDWVERVVEALHAVDVRNPSRPGDRCASVLFPIVERGGPHLLGIVRTDRGRHGGQFALPGGTFEDSDADPWDTALREACEEIGLDQDVVRLGELGELNTFVSRYRVFVHVAFLPVAQPWVLQEDEVEAVLEIPFPVLVDRFRDFPVVDDVWHLPIQVGFDLDPGDFLVAGRVPPRGRGHRLETPEGPREMPYIWGLTARILYAFLQEVWIPQTRG